MAISVASVTFHSLYWERSSALSAVSSSSSSPSISYPNLSSLQFRHQSPFARVRNKKIFNPSRPCVLPLVQAKKQTFASFDDLLETSHKPVLVDFYATWCGPCQFMVPILNDVSAKLKDEIQVVKIDTEKYPAIANKYRIEALPTFIIFKDGKPLDRFEGALTADQLTLRVQSLLELKQ